MHDSDILLLKIGIPDKNNLFATLPTNWISIAKLSSSWLVKWLAELQKVGILVSRIPDIFWRKSGHFQIIAVNLSIFDIKKLQHWWFMTQFNSKWRKLRRKHAFVQFCASYLGQIQLIQDSDIFLLKIRIPDEKNLFATLCFNEVSRMFHASFMDRKF